jgi:putative sterol carrier protein
MGIDLHSLVDLLPKTFLPERAEGVNAMLQLRLTGEQAGEWVVTIADKKCSVKSGKVENPTLTIEASTQDVLDVFTGKLEPMKAYMQGKMKVSGNLMQAPRLLGLFSADQLKKE